MEKSFKFINCRIVPSPIFYQIFSEMTTPEDKKQGNFFMFNLIMDQPHGSKTTLTSTEERKFADQRTLNKLKQKKKSSKNYNADFPRFC